MDEELSLERMKSLSQFIKQCHQNRRDKVLCDVEIRLTGGTAYDPFKQTADLNLPPPQNPEEVKQITENPENNDEEPVATIPEKIPEVKSPENVPINKIPSNDQEVKIAEDKPQVQDDPEAKILSTEIPEKIPSIEIPPDGQTPIDTPETKIPENENSSAAEIPMESSEFQFHEVASEVSLFANPPEETVESIENFIAQVASCPPPSDDPDSMETVEVICSATASTESGSPEDEQLLAILSDQTPDDGPEVMDSVHVENPHDRPAAGENQQEEIVMAKVLEESTAENEKSVKVEEAGDVEMTEEEEPTIHAHRIILASASPFLMRRLQAMEPGQILTIDGINRDIFEFLLDYMYTRSIGPIDESRMFEIFTGAKLLELTEMDAKCSALILRSRSVENCLRIWIFGHEKDCETGLKCPKFIFQNFDEISVTPDFLSLTYEQDVGLKDWDVVMMHRQSNNSNRPLAPTTTGSSSSSGSLLSQFDFSNIQVPKMPGRGQSTRNPFQGGLGQEPIVDDPATIPDILLNNNPEQMALVQQNNPTLAEFLKKAFKMIKELQAHRQEREKQQRRLLATDPFDLEAQWLIDEEIRQKNVEANMEAAMEYNPESFGTVIMLFVNCKVNGHPVKAFVDSGAQQTIMSAECAERCHIMRLVDTRFAAIAKGVGTQKILGRVHMAQIQIGNDFLTSSFSILEDQSMDMLLGLDMLKSHQCMIDLKRNLLIMGTTATKTSFLPECELPDVARLTFRSTKEEGQALVKDVYVRSGATARASSSFLTPNSVFHSEIVIAMQHGEITAGRSDGGPPVPPPPNPIDSVFIPPIQNKRLRKRISYKQECKRLEGQIETLKGQKLEAQTEQIQWLLHTPELVPLLGPSCVAKRLRQLVPPPLPGPSPPPGPPPPTGQQSVSSDETVGHQEAPDSTT